LSVRRRIAVNWAPRPGEILSEPKSRKWWEQLSPAVLLLWVLVICAAMWAGIVAIAWAVWHVL
jgi:hypothetical protein